RKSPEGRVLAVAVDQHADEGTPERDHVEAALEDAVDGHGPGSGGRRSRRREQAGKGSSEDAGVAEAAFHSVDFLPVVATAPLPGVLRQPGQACLALGGSPRVMSSSSPGKNAPA